jgi:two-component system NarL family sensor kinase
VNLPLLIGIGITVMLLLGAGIILFVILYQRRVIAHQETLKKINEQNEIDLIQAAIRSEEDERSRIATELHDDVAATLATARLFLYKGKDAGFDEERINQSKDLLDDSIRKLRNISHKLQPSMLQHLGLELSLQSLIETLNKSGNIRAEYIAQSELAEVPESVGLSTYRIAQELITNILKHAQSTSITLYGGTVDNAIVLTFIYDGYGLTNDMYQQLIYKKGSTGLKNIVNRLKSISAAIRYYREDELYKTEVRIPLQNNQLNPA